MNVHSNLQHELDEVGRQLDPGRSLAESVMARVRETQILPAPSHSVSRIMRNLNWTRMCAAAAVFLVVALACWSLWDGSTTPTYAFTQTVQATHSVKSVHLTVKRLRDLRAPETAEMWIEFGDDGRLSRARVEAVDYPGPKRLSIVWSNHEARIWSKDENVCVTRRDETAGSSLRQLVEEVDPKLCVEILRRLEEAGQVKLEIQESGDGKKPVIVTATYLPHSSSPEKRLIVSVDPVTKLITKVDLRKKVADGYQHDALVEIVSYNEPIKPERFILDLPDDVRQIDVSERQVGLLQGDMTDKQVAVEVVRQTFQALIDRDFEKAARLARHGLMSAELIRKGQRGFTISRIVSISDPAPGPEPTRQEKEMGIKRPFSLTITIEGEKDGQQETREVKILAMQVRGQRERWTCLGDPSDTPGNRPEAD